MQHLQGEGRERAQTLSVALWKGTRNIWNDESEMHFSTTSVASLKVVQTGTKVEGAEATRSVKFLDLF